MTNVVVLDSDQRAARQLLHGFRRDGVAATAPVIPKDPATLEIGNDTALVIVGGDDLGLLRLAREILDDKQLDVTVLFAGGGGRAAAEAAGADEVLEKPAYLRDVVTIGRLLRGVKPDARGHLIGNLGELTNVLSLVRAFTSLGRSATLTLMRGLRRGEVRFYRGEVTSAQVGLIHGQAALHQLLLWTDARFDFHYEDVVRRQQIPMTNEDLFADAERFLEGIKDSSGALSPAMVLEQDVQRLHGLGKQIPTEVHGVLRMFDGHRVLADILEDSPYRVFETLRVAQRAMEAGLLRVVKSQRPKATWRAVLGIEEWLVSTEPRDKADEDTEQEDGDPSASIESPHSPAGFGSTKLPSTTKKKATRRNRRHRRANTPLPIKVAPAKPAAQPTIDWGALVPRAIGSDVGTLSTVVPAAALSGEIRLPTRELEREKLESLMDTGKRDKIFPSEIDQPSIVFDDRSGPVGMPPAADPAPVVQDIAIPRTESAQYREDTQDRVKQIVQQQEAERAAAVRSRLELEARGSSSTNTREKLESEIRARRSTGDAPPAEPEPAPTDTMPIPKAELDEIVGGDSEAPTVTPTAPAPRASREDDSFAAAAAFAALPIELPPSPAGSATSPDAADRARRASEAKALADAFAGRKSADTIKEVDRRNAGQMKPELGSASDLVSALRAEAEETPDQVRARRNKATSVPPYVVDETSHPLAAVPVPKGKRVGMEPLAKPAEPAPAPTVSASPATTEVAKVASDASSIAASVGAHLSAAGKVHDAAAITDRGAADARVIAAAIERKASETARAAAEALRIQEANRAKQRAPNHDAPTDRGAADAAVIQAAIDRAAADKAAAAKAAELAAAEASAAAADRLAAQIALKADADRAASERAAAAEAAKAEAVSAADSAAITAPNLGVVEADDTSTTKFEKSEKIELASTPAKAESKPAEAKEAGTEARPTEAKPAEAKPTAEAKPAEAKPSAEAKPAEAKADAVAKTDAKADADAKTDAKADASKPVESRTKSGDRKRREPTEPPVSVARTRTKTVPPTEPRAKTPSAPQILVERKSSQKMPAVARTSTKDKKKTGQSSPNIATSAGAKAVDDLRKDAAALSEFSDDEEAFFRGGDEQHAPVNKPVHVESFDDLDEGYQPVGFWDRLLGRKKPKK